MIKNFYEMNDYLIDILKDSKPASIIRLDNTAGYIIDCVTRNREISSQFFNPSTILEGGVYPNNEEYAINVVYKKTFECMMRADCVGFVDISKEIKTSSPLLNILKDKVTFFTDGHMVFDPASILGFSKLYLEELTHPETIDPWTSYLAGKKVLVISTHAESIKHQWKNKSLVWGPLEDKVANYELVDVIRAPYHPHIDVRQYPNCQTWEDMTNYVKRMVDKYDFDVLLSGASTSSPLFVDHAKSIGKIGIQTGGVIQLLFGVKGGRWAKVAGYSEWNNMFNDHWIFPLKIDEPQNRVHGLESNFAYWG